jgi:hypothetical protein
MYLVDTNVISAGAPSKAVSAEGLLKWMDAHSTKLFVHDAIMRSERIFTHAENVMEHDSAGRMVHKLARTFLDQLNAWQRNRTAGDQKVTVLHGSVSGGGQTIVGHVTQAPGANVADKVAAASPLTSSKPQTDPTGDRGGGQGTSQSRRGMGQKNK